MPQRVNIREYVEKLKGEGILQKISQADFNEPRAIFIPCADMDRYDDWYSHMKFLFGRPPHPLSQNGGALQITLNPLRKMIFIEDAEDALIAKKANQIVVLSHWPCLIAGKHNMFPDEVIRRTVNAAALVRGYFNSHQKFQMNPIRVFAHFHADYEDALIQSEIDRPMETYSINEQTFLKQGLPDPLNQMSYA